MYSTWFQLFLLILKDLIWVMAIKGQGYKSNMLVEIFELTWSPGAKDNEVIGAHFGTRESAANLRSLPLSDINKSAHSGRL